MGKAKLSVSMLLRNLLFQKKRDNFKEGKDKKAWDDKIFGSEMFAINLKLFFWSRETLTRLNCCLPWEERLSSPNHDQIYLSSVFLQLSVCRRIKCSSTIDGLRWLPMTQWYIKYYSMYMLSLYFMTKFKYTERKTFSLNTKKKKYLASCGRDQLQDCLHEGENRKPWKLSNVFSF